MVEVVDYRAQVVERLKALLEQRGWSVAGVERALGRGRGYVADALRGEKKLTLETLLDCLAVVGVTPGQLFEEPATRVQWGGEVAEGRPEEREPAGWRDASLLVQALVLLLDQKGLVTLREVVACQRQLTNAAAPSRADAELRRP